jgi:hypothetical protein
MSHKLSKSFLFFRQNQGYYTPNVHDIHATISQARQLRSKKLIPLVVICFHPARGSGVPEKNISLTTNPTFSDI